MTLSSGSDCDVVDRPQRAALPVEAVDDADRVDAGARAVLAAHQRGPGGLAVRAAGVAVGEPHPLGGQAVDVRRLVVLAAEAADVGVAEVVGQDEDDIRPRFRGRGGRDHDGRRQGQQSQQTTHDGSLHDSLQR